MARAKIKGVPKNRKRRKSKKKSNKKRVYVMTDPFEGVGVVVRIPGGGGFLLQN